MKIMTILIITAILFNVIYSGWYSHLKLYNKDKVMYLYIKDFVLYTYIHVYNIISTVNSVLLPVILFRSTGIRLLIWTNIVYALTTLSIQTILSPDMGRSANHATSQSTHNLCGGRTLNKMKTIAEHQFRVVHLNGHQQVFLMIFLFDRLETGIRSKISKSLIAHYCS